MGFLESRILYFSVILLIISFSYPSRSFQCHIQQENEVSLQTRGFPSWPEDLDCSTYIKSLCFEGFQPEVWSFLQDDLYGMQAKKQNKKTPWKPDTPKTQKSNQPVTVWVPLQIIIRHMGHNVRLWDWENTGYKRAGGNMLGATGMWWGTFPPLKKDPAPERLLLAQCLMWKGLVWL